MGAPGGRLPGATRSGLAGRQITLEFTDTARGWLANRGFDPVYGARPLNRAIQQEVETPLAQRLIAGGVLEGARLGVDVGPGGSGLVFIDLQPPVSRAA